MSYRGTHNKFNNMERISGNPVKIWQAIIQIESFASFKTFWILALIKKKEFNDLKSGNWQKFH